MVCWPSSEEVWGTDLAAVQDAIVGIAQAIARFEPVSMLARAEEIEGLRHILGEVELVPAPVDDLWARDTLPNFVVRANKAGERRLAATHATFNGWGDKQIHDGDAQLAAVVAQHVGVELLEFGLVGEGGAVEVDGTFDRALVRHPRFRGSIEPRKCRVLRAVGDRLTVLASFPERSVCISPTTAPLVPTSAAVPDFGEVLHLPAGVHWIQEVWRRNDFEA
mgnify:CR=1 FL=1